MATKKAKPNGIFQIFDTAHFTEIVATQRVDSLPGVGYALKKKLADVQIDFVNDLVRYGKSRLQNLIGEKAGSDLFGFAVGIDDRELQSAALRKTIGAEINWGVRFSSHQDLVAFLKELAEVLWSRSKQQVEERMSEAQVVGRCCTLKIKKRLVKTEPTYKYGGRMKRITL